MILIDLTANDDDEEGEQDVSSCKNRKKIPQTKNARKMSSATRLEWLKRVKRKGSLKSVVATSTKSSGNRVEIADAHSTNNCENVEEFAKKAILASDGEKSAERAATLAPSSPSPTIERTDSTINETVDSTVAMDLENSSLPLAAWLQSLQAANFDSVAPIERSSTSRYPETSLLSLCQNYGLSGDLSEEKNQDGGFDAAITNAERVGASRAPQFDDILNSILNDDLSMLDDQAILEDSLGTKSGDADLDCLIDFHLPSIDSPADESSYSSVRSVDPRLTRRTIGVKDPPLSDGISVTPGVSSLRTKDSLLNGAKDQPPFAGRAFEDVEAGGEGAIADRFGLGIDYACNRRDLFGLPLLDHAESIMELAGNDDAIPEDVGFPDESLIVDCKRLKDYDEFPTTNLPRIANANRRRVESTITSNLLAERDPRTHGESRIDDETGDAASAAIHGPQALAHSSLSNVSSTTAYREYLARQSGATMREPALETPEGPQQQQQQHRRLRKCDKLPAKMIQVAQVSSPKSINARRKLSPRAAAEQHDLSATLGRSLVDSEESAVKRRKENSGRNS